MLDAEVLFDHAHAIHEMIDVLGVAGVVLQFGINRVELIMNVSDLRSYVADFGAE